MTASTESVDSTRAPAREPDSVPTATIDTPPAQALVVRGARTHNLRGVDCRVPHGAVTVVTGVSGAGKSSLAFDTIYAEAQRRFVESMSTYVRQFLEQMERPPVDALEGVLPTIALEARNAIKNARSTVGTLTEVHDVLRLLFTHLGEVSCPHGHVGPDGGSSVHGFGPQELADHLLERFDDGTRIVLLADLERPRRNADVKLRELVRQGYFRHWVEDEDGAGSIERLESSSSKASSSKGQAVKWPKALDPLTLALGRFKLEASKRGRLIAAIEEGYLLTAGRLRIAFEDKAFEDRAFKDGAFEGSDEPQPILHVGRALTCEVCGERMERPTPALFSFNSPLGACPTCQGFGRVLGVDPARVIPDPTKSLDERPIAPWNSPAYQKHYPKLLAAARERGVRTDVPIEDLDDAEREFLWRGTGRHFQSIDRFFARLERKSYKMHVRILLARYRSYEPCPTCKGRRLRPESLGVRVAGRTIAELGALSVEDLRAWAADDLVAAMPSGRRAELAGHVAEQLRTRLDTLHRVGLGYLTFDRQGRTLSGGEAQRIQLASALGSGLTGTLYVLDEPTIGLHPQDSGRLLGLLGDLAARGNTVLVVEHDRTLIEGADHVIDLGPLAGEHGGEVVAEGDLRAVLASERSLTAEYLREPPQAPPRAELKAAAQALESAPQIVIRGARENNLRDLDVSFPRHALVAVTGVSGSGKSTLIASVLHGSYQRARGVVDVEPGAHDALEGVDELADIVLVDQRPLGRSSRSNPVTYVKAYDEIRKLYAKTPDAVRKGIAAGHFSFNIDRGRCPECKGTGTQEVDMHFMAPVEVVCEACDGRRFLPEVLGIKLRGRSIDETLELTVDEALELFADRKPLHRKLAVLRDVGLGYLRLGQSTSTLSGGEAQRLKLASFLDKKSKDGPRLFLFDEPTTGLHLADIDLLHSTLRRLVERGDGVVVVEHSTDLIARADWIVDLGPGGGVHGGELLYSGPLLGMLEEGEGATAGVLRGHLGWGASS
ncbi:MAG: excinuclease ABC subunit UvrA [Acidobacteriota bacterium]